MALCGLAVLDVKRNTAYHLNAFQTVDLTEGESLLQFYARMLLLQKDALQKLSPYLVADAYFSKAPFVSPMCQAAFHLISRLRDDANLHYLLKGKQKPRGRKKIYFSTDLSQDWQEVLKYYRLRFQIEFLYRDAKQHTGLNDCQARSRAKLHFHWNLSLTAINLAKILHWIPLVDKQPNVDIPFSMRDVKTLYSNRLLLNLFFRKFGVNPAT